MLFPKVGKDHILDVVLVPVLPDDPDSQKGRRDHEDGVSNGQSQNLTDVMRDPTFFAFH